MTQQEKIDILKRAGWEVLAILGDESVRMVLTFSRPPENLSALIRPDGTVEE